MNAKAFDTVKNSLIVLVVVTVFIVITYMIVQRDAQFRQSHFNSLIKSQLQKLDKLLSADAQAALIRQVVKSSLKEIILFHNQSRLTQLDTQFRQSHFNSFIKSQLHKLDKLLSADEEAALIRQVVKSSLTEILLLQNQSQLSNLRVQLKSLSQSDAYNSKTDSSKLQRIFHYALNLNQNHSVRNSELKAFQIQTTIEERQMMYTLLEVFDKTMKRNNITYFMYGGTLLGSYRHHDLIPWDDDIDVMLSVKNHKDMDNILTQLSPEFIFCSVGGHHKLYHTSSKKTSANDWCWPYLDISYYEENGTFIKDRVQTYDKWFYFPKEIVFPLHNRPLLNLSLPAPRDTFAFLIWKYNYGSPCLMYGYSHMVEGDGPIGNTDCRLLADKFPFVEHYQHQKGVREVLKYKDIEISDIVVPEPNYAVSETFSLSLKREYKMPSHIFPPPS